MSGDEISLLFAMRPDEEIMLDKLVWPDHGIQQKHLAYPERPRSMDRTPIHVERLVTGHYFIHDGRHRVLRAKLRGETRILAKVIDRWTW